MSDPRNTPIRSDVNQALARARLARFIAALFGEEDAARLIRLGETTLREEVLAAAQTLQLDPNPLRQVFLEWPSPDDLADSHGRLLGHTVRSTCPPYELEYCQSEVFQQSQRLADIAGFYAAFGLEMAGAIAERPDHFVAEWEFLSTLALKEAHAIETGASEAIACCRDAQRAFLMDHAAAWMFAFFERLRRSGGDGFLALAADVAAAALREWCAARDLPTGPEWLELREISDEDAQIECGAPGAATVELGPTLAAAMERMTPSTS